MKIAIIGGLVDGINPCAFAVMVFLVSFLSIKKENILAPCSMFILGVFVLYFLLGIGGYYLLSHIPIVFTQISTRIISLFIISFGLVNIFEKVEKPVLSLSKPQRRKIHSLIIKTGLQNKKIYFFLCGIVVGLTEATCTGQVYLPVIYSFVALKLKNAFFHLFLYNIFFILPLGFVGILGIVSKNFLKSFDTRYVKKMKLVLGIFLIFLGIFLFKIGCKNCQKQGGENAQKMVNDIAFIQHN